MKWLALSLLFMVLFSGCLKSTPDVKACVNDSDCIEVNSLECCTSCSGCETAINKEYKDYWNSKREQDCEGIVCAMIASPIIYEPKCVNNSCKLVSNLGLPPELTKIRVCPDEEIMDQFPGGSGSHYYIINGSRVEISDVDTDWVKENCPPFLSGITS
jgi:hypothetical protein